MSKKKVYETIAERALNGTREERVTAVATELKMYAMYNLGYMTHRDCTEYEDKYGEDWENDELLEELYGHECSMLVAIGALVEETQDVWEPYFSEYIDDKQLIDTESIYNIGDDFASVYIKSKSAFNIEKQEKLFRKRHMQ